VARPPIDDSIDRLLSRPPRSSSAPGDVCPDADILSAFVDGALPASERTRLETHLASCARCVEIVAASAAAEPVLPPREAAVWWRLAWWQWATPLAAVSIAFGVWLITRPDVRYESDMAATSTSTSAEIAAPEVPVDAVPGNAPEPGVLLPVPSLEVSPQAVEERADRQGEALARKAEEPGLSQRAEASDANSAARGAPAAPPQPAAAPPPRTDAPSPPASQATLAPPSVARLVPGPAPTPPPQAFPEQARAAAAAAGAQAARGQDEVPVTAGVAAVTRAAQQAQGRGGGGAAAFAQPGPVRANDLVSWRALGVVIERSADAGATWAQEYSAISPVRGGTAVSPEIAWFFTGDGIVLRRTASGWSSSNIGGGIEIGSITATSASDAVVRLVDGRELRTSDAGATWTP
jgi:hypothetical protein